MNADMEVDIFAEQPYGRAALQKFGSVPVNFRLYQAGWLGKKPEEFTVMKVDGAEFCVAETGCNIGKLAIMVPGTSRTVYVTRGEMSAHQQQGK